MKDVLITVKTVQINEEDKTELELTTEGNFAVRDGAFLITYEDSMMSDELGVVNTSIKVKGKVVTISRSGAYRSKFTVEKGKRCNSLYETPFGRMTMGFFGEEVVNNLTEDGGKLSVKYSVDVNNSEINKNEIYVSVREA